MSLPPRSLSILILIVSLLALLATWEVAGRVNSTVAFAFSYPTAVLSDLIEGVLHGDLLTDALYTLLPAVIGLVMGVAVGGGAGFALVASPEIARTAKPLVEALGAFPVFAIAPMTLIWFGLGLTPKIFLAFVSCVFLFLQAAYNGGLSAPARITTHMRVHGFTAADEFLKIRLPFAIEWLTAAFKTCANLALLGVFIGEFIAAEHGLARTMLRAGAVYDIKRVLSAALLFTVLALGLMAIADLIHKQRIRLVRWISVPSQTRG